MAATPKSEGRIYGGMTPEERDERRREQFLDAGLELFARDGWSGTTVQSLCSAAGLSQRYFYDHFSGRDALFMAVVERIGQNVEKIVRRVAGRDYADADDRTRAVLRELADGFIADPRTVRVALVESFATPEFRRFRSRMLGDFSALAAELMLHLHPDPERADKRALQIGALVLTGGIAEALIAGVSGRVPATVDELVELLTALWHSAATIQLPPAG